MSSAYDGRTTRRASQYEGKTAADITAALRSFAAAYASVIEESSHAGACTSDASGAGKKKCSPRIARPCPAAIDCESFA
ncbi:MAG: hypothetical protein E6G03_16190 [Actinobacteria bacterium]|nr:MAG: hypothetical protein E6G03_16190 [Actinomycetota bacterium]